MSIHNPATVYEAINGTSGQHGFDVTPMVVVNPEESGITGWGDPNAGLVDPSVDDHGVTEGDDYDTQNRGDLGLMYQQFQTGHTQNRVTEESAEYGYGVGPERKLSHYPYADQPNPFRNHDAYGRWSLDDESRYRPEVVAYWAEAMGYEMSQAIVKQRSPVTPVVNQPPSQPYTDYVSPGGYYG